MTTRLIEISQQLRRLRAVYDDSSRILESAFANPALEARASRLRPLVEECAAATHDFLEALEALPEYKK